jgi:hypothetical protein
MTGAPNAASSSRITCGGIDEEDERMKRSGFSAMTARLPPARATMA